ncbi:hypothetical protein [Amycolatopsis pittospori]|uniref:hypothetical protein n=1 Tax=Amycolatopsis pittospori TaxID=2749434 RepID=UPI0015F122DC|nr:hypothetical protein [Amycolatopsis pittospori]
MITGPVKAELLEVFEQALKDVRDIVRALEDVSSLVQVADRDLRLALSLVIGEQLGNASAGIDRIRRRIEEVETYEDRRKKEK